MPVYAPGSFTKNFGWNLAPPGLNRLVVIRAGFGGVAQRVTRNHFRTHCGISDRQLIPVNFFLHNRIVGGVNYVTADELVRHAINNPHSRRFDQLAIFSMHLARMGRRVGVAGDPGGAAFANDFVRNRLWNSQTRRSLLQNSAFPVSLLPIARARIVGCSESPCHRLPRSDHGDNVFEAVASIQARGRGQSCRCRLRNIGRADN
jgi:hypothetical protein